jgi:hypothetical protein
MELMSELALKVFYSLDVFFRLRIKLFSLFDINDRFDRRIFLSSLVLIFGYSNIVLSNNIEISY